MVLEHALQVHFAGLTTHFALFLPLFRRNLSQRYGQNFAVYALGVLLGYTEQHCVCSDSYNSLFLNALYSRTTVLGQKSPFARLGPHMDTVGKCSVELPRASPRPSLTGGRQPRADAPLASPRTPWRAAASRRWGVVMRNISAPVLTPGGGADRPPWRAPGAGAAVRPGAPRPSSRAGTWQSRTPGRPWTRGVQSGLRRP